MSNHTNQGTLVNAIFNLFCLNRTSQTQARKIKDCMRATQLLSQKDDNWVFSKHTGINFLALSAITECNREIIGGSGIAKALFYLISAESQEGGPYYSLADGLPAREIDLGVNAVIAYFISLHDIHLPKVYALVDAAIENEYFSSKFFASEYQTIYFISRTARSRIVPNQKMKLINYILGEKRGGGWRNFTDNIFAIFSLQELGCEQWRFADAIQSLQDNERCAASDYTLCANEQMAIKSTPATNVALRDAAMNWRGNCAQEANEKERFKTAAPNAQEQHAIDKITRIAGQRFSNLSHDLKRFAMLEMQKTMHGNTDRQMSLMAFYTKQSLGARAEHMPDDLVARMGLANIFFWTAFIIYDDFWDEDEKANPQILPTANLYARDFTEFFSSILSPETRFRDFCREVMDELDAANTWETVHCRTKVKNGIFTIPEILPDYSNYERKYQPASGHILGPTAMFYMLGYEENSEETQNLIAYFRNYLIAMQINDDAHDWEEDMRRGHLSTVVVMLLNEWKEQYPEKQEIDMEEDAEKLQQIFWFKTVPRSSAAAIEHTKRSRDALYAIKILENRAPLERFIDITENVAKEALREQEKSVAFLREFQNAR